MGKDKPNHALIADGEAFDLFGKYVTGDLDAGSTKAMAAKLIESSQFKAPTLRFFGNAGTLDDPPSLGEFDRALLEAPLWLGLAAYDGQLRRVAAIILSEIVNRDIAPKALAAIHEFELTYGKILEAIESMNNVSPATQMCFEMLLLRAGAEIGVALQNTFPRWRESVAKAKKDNTAKKYSWRNELDKRPRWMERKPRGEDTGWSVSSEQILMVLAGVFEADDLPDQTTINRERKKRLKEQE